MGSVSIGQTTSLPKDGTSRISAAGVHDPDSAGLARFSPTNFSNLVLWLDGDDFDTITQLGGDISQWADKSPSKNNAVQTTGSAQPTFVRNGLHGKSIISFDGTSEFFTTNALVLDPSTEFSIFAVAELTPSSLLRNIFSQAGGTTTILGKRNNSNEITSRLDGPFIDGAVVSGAPQIYNLNHEITQPDNLLSIFTDGVLGVTTDVTLSSETGIWVIGANQQQNGGFMQRNLYEIIIYNRFLSESERKDVEQYLGANWGITLG